ncbi:hypothetical protein GCM10011579_006790 [Streptomyces albiflavescens]|uniref:Uncharacterized protein n=1 Tax=Streptomyces albiflavescens TaxID=1623582 RepID=A0A917XRX6_9ACTN|nr:hypothetical protein GCM10011579_006790 [Streptomyces albiflavescens]
MFLQVGFIGPIEDLQPLAFSRQPRADAQVGVTPFPGNGSTSQAFTDAPTVRVQARSTPPEQEEVPAPLAAHAEAVAHPTFDADRSEDTPADALPIKLQRSDHD